MFTVRISALCCIRKNAFRTHRMSDLHNEAAALTKSYRLIFLTLAAQLKDLLDFVAAWVLEGSLLLAVAKKKT